VKSGKDFFNHPSKAMISEEGKMIFKVSRLNGTDGFFILAE
jgi:hypothetical protein